MGWKDTVMSDEQVFEVLPGYYDSMKFMWDANLEHSPSSNPTISPEYRKIIEAQAEITWKARDKEVEEAYEKGFTDAKDIATQQAYEAGIDSGRKNGRGETVKFVDDNSHIQSTLGDWARIIPDEKWQAFKKKALEGE